MSAVGTILLHSPGCNEGTARNATLGTHGQKQNELRRSGTITRAFVLRLGSVAPLVLKNVRALHNTALAALLATFRFGHLQE